VLGLQMIRERTFALAAGLDIEEIKDEIGLGVIDDVKLTYTPWAVSSSMTIWNAPLFLCPGILLVGHGGPSLLWWLIVSSGRLQTRTDLSCHSPTRVGRE